MKIEKSARAAFSLEQHYIGDVGSWQILLQKSKVASARIFGEIFEREAIDDSDNLSRAAEVAYEFRVGR